MVSAFVLDDTPPTTAGTSDRADSDSVVDVDGAGVTVDVVLASFDVIPPATSVDGFDSVVVGTAVDDILLVVVPMEVTV